MKHSLAISIAFVLLLTSCTRRPPEQQLIEDGIKLYEQGRYEEAHATFERAAEAAGPESGQEIRAEILYHAGLALLKLDRYTEARDRLIRAEALFTDLAQPGRRADCLRSLGFIAQEQGNLIAARSLIDQAHEGHRHAGEAKAAAMDLIYLANTNLFMGDLRKALDLYQKAGRKARAAEDLRTAGNAHLGVGMVRINLGEYEESIEVLSEALESFRQAGYRLGESKAFNNMGVACLMNTDYRTAISHFERALAIKRELGDQGGVGLAHLNMGKCRLELGEIDRARTEAREGLRINTAIENRRGIALAHKVLGDIAMARGKWDEALGELGELENYGEEMKIPECLWLSRLKKGQVFESLGDPKAAVTSYLAAVDVVEDMRSQLLSRGHRIGFMEDKFVAYKRLVGLLAGQGRQDEAFACMERARARTLLEIITAHPRLYAPSDRERAARVREVSDAIEALAARIRAEAMRVQRPAGAELDEWAEELEGLKRQKRRLLDEAADGSVAGLLGAVRPMSLAEIQNRLTPGLAVLEYFITEKKVLVAFLTRDRFRLIEASGAGADPDREIERHIAALSERGGQEALSASAAGSGEHGRALYRLLFEPVRSLLDEIEAKRICVIPHGRLHFLPFQALHDGKGFLAEQYTIFYAPSATILAMHIGQKKGRCTGRTGTETGPEARETQALSATGKEGAPKEPVREEADVVMAWNPHARLEFVEAEKEALRRYRPSAAAVTGEAEVKQTCSGPCLLHFATHVVRDPANPLFSYIDLLEGDGEDGRLEAHEVFGLSLEADLVVLSSCESGLGRLTRGDEVLGLTEAFLFAGAGAVVSTLWRVDDRASSLLMERFYRHLAALPPEEALRRAQLDLLGGPAGSEFRTPYFWAPFVLTAG